MCNLKGKLVVLLFGLIGIINVSHAALNNLGNGLVNDSTLNITWMQDANLVKTSCDANNALWAAFNPSALQQVRKVAEQKHKFARQTELLIGLRQKHGLLF